MDKELRVIISGGGTGGHIFPAVSIANAIKSLRPDAKILFVGALGRMEMQRVPAAGYEIKGLPIRGFFRPLWKPANIGVAIDYLKSKWLAKKILKQFRPQVAVGVGGYASSAALGAANSLGIPTLIQEQNSYAGLANKTLAKSASKICVAYEGMERFFPADKIILTGNPVRQNLLKGVKQITSDIKHLLIIGGSLGARTINEAVLAGIPALEKAGIHVVWQTGKGYYKGIMEQINNNHLPVTNIEIHEFLSDMPDRYAQADLVISRAGASSISELCLLGKPAILVPSPNVAEDHQTHNAMALVNKNAAVLVKDAEAADKLISTALELIHNEKQLELLHTNVLKLAQTDSAKRIAEEVISLAKH